MQSRISIAKPCVRQVRFDAKPRQPHSTRTVNIAKGRRQVELTLSPKRAAGTASSKGVDVF